MSELEVGTCRSCGARLAPEAEQCSLCGWPVGADDHDLRDEADEATPEPGIRRENSVPATGESGERKPFCHMCGWQNPAGARFCSACGTRLQNLTVNAGSEQISPGPKKTSRAPARPAKASTKKAVRPDQDPAVETAQPAPKPIEMWQVGVLVLAGVLVVAALYMITGFSKRAFPRIETTAAQAQTQTRGQAESQQSGTQNVGQNLLGADLSEDVARQVEALEAEAEGLSGDALIAKKREIVSVLSEAGRPDRAAPVQEEIASAVNTAEDWFQAGHFLYDWMDTLGGEQRFIIAQRAATAYESGLSIKNDLNVRTALAMAYLNTRTPMLGVQNIRQVLAEEPDNLQGNFYYGVMLMQINRLDQAEAQFERVKQLVGEGSELYERADMMLQNLRSMK